MTSSTRPPDIAGRRSHDQRSRWRRQALPRTRRAKDEIDHLLNFVAASSCTFVRNGTEYPSDKARDHLASSTSSPAAGSRRPRSSSSISPRKQHVGRALSREVRKDRGAVGCVADERAEPVSQGLRTRASGTLSSTAAAASRRLANNGRRSSAISTRRRKSRPDRASDANPAVPSRTCCRRNFRATSPARRAPVIRGIDRPHARSNAAIAAITDVAAPLPRLTVTRPGLA